MKICFAKKKSVNFKIKWILSTDYGELQLTYVKETGSPSKDEIVKII